MARHNEEWEATKAELYAEDWWKANGYEATLIKRYLSKSIYKVSKDGLSTDYEVPFSVKDKKKFMESFPKFWALLTKTTPANR